MKKFETKFIEKRRNYTIFFDVIPIAVQTFVQTRHKFSDFIATGVSSQIRQYLSYRDDEFFVLKS